MLDKAECMNALIALDLFSKDSDLDFYFQELDTDKSGFLNWDEFRMLARLSSLCNAVIDYIPLKEIHAVEFELVARDSREGRGEDEEAMKPWDSAGTSSAEQGAGGVGSDKPAEAAGPDFSAEALRNERLLRKPTLLQRSIHLVEEVTGLEIERSKEQRTRRIPHYNPAKFEVHLVIMTEEGGHNAGKTYVHRVPDNTAQKWLDQIGDRSRRGLGVDASLRGVGKSGTCREWEMQRETETLRPNAGERDR